MHLFLQVSDRPGLFYGIVTLAVPLEECPVDVRATTRTVYVLAGEFG